VLPSLLPLTPEAGPSCSQPRAVDEIDGSVLELPTPTKRATTRSLSRFRPLLLLGDPNRFSSGFTTPYIIPRLVQRAVMEQLAQQDVETLVHQAQPGHGS
jgi:hypothetical protein